MSKIEGICYCCEKVGSKVVMKNHVMKMHNDGEEACYLLRAESAYKGHPHWILFSVPLSASLKVVDQFLRKIWCECCGHLSSFSTKYGEVNNATKIANFNVKDVLTYEYDFGTTTELLVTIVGEINRPKRGQKVQLLARNFAQVFKCSTCDEDAAYIDTEDWDGYFACYDCYEFGDETGDEERYFEKITNSPRCGACCYDGSDDEWSAEERSLIVRGQLPVIERTVVESLDDELDAMFFDDEDEPMITEENFYSVTELRDSEMVDDFLTQIAVFEAYTNDEITQLFIKEDFDELELYSKYVAHYMAVIRELTDEEKAGHDLSHFTAVYDTVAVMMTYLANIFGEEGLGLERLTLPKADKLTTRVSDEALNLFGESNVATVQEKWDRIPADYQDKALKNAFCINCGIVALKPDFEVIQDKLGIIIAGNCKKCNSKVMRLIEEV